MANKKTKIALVIEQGFGARVLLQTNILKNLLLDEFDICVLTSGYQSIRDYLDKSGLSSIPVYLMNTDKYHKRNQKLLVRLCKFTRLYCLNTQTMKDSFDLQIKDSKISGNRNHKIFIKLVQVLVTVCRLHIKLAKLLIICENKLATVKSNTEFFINHEPDILITTSLGNFDHDDYILREAKCNKIKTITYILGWDNTSTRGHGIGLSDQIITWSEIMRNELIDIHGLNPSQIEIGGVSHYDAYDAKADNLWSKKTLYNALNIPQDKELIIFGTKSPSSYLSNQSIVRSICHWIATDTKLQNHILVCRLHPIYFRDNRNKSGSHFGEDWNKLVEEIGSDKLIIDYPEILDGDLNYFMPANEIYKLGSLLKHSKLSINMFSTLNLEASIFDIPSINVAFQDKNPEILGFKQSRYNIKVDHNKTHTQRLINTNATSVTSDYDELLSSIKEELSNPDDKSIYRKQLVQQECHTNIGDGGQLVSEIIRSFCSTL